MTPRRIVIAGGGITGLAAAHAVKHQAAEAGRDVSVRLFERSACLGGKLVTREKDGFLIEGGPDSFITQKPWALDLCRQLGLEDELLPCNTAGQKVFLAVQRKCIPLPDGFRLTAPTNIGAFLRSPLLSWPGKIRALAEPLIPPGAPSEDESLSSFVTRRFGREMVDRIAGPLMAGIFVADPDALSMTCSFPRFLDIERQGSSITRALLKQARSAKKREHPSPPMFMTLRGGTARLAEALVDDLGAGGHPGTGLTAIHPRQDGAPGYVLQLEDGSSTEADAVILAIPAAAAASLLGDLHTASAAVLARFTTVSSATVSLAYRDAGKALPQPPEGFGFVVPPEDPCRLLACTYSSNKFAHRAPSEGLLFRAFLGGARDPDRASLSEDRLVQLVRDELGHILGLRGEPDFTAVYRWIDANPQYPVGHATRVHAIEQDLQRHVPHLYLAGAPYHGVGIPDCIHSAQRAARRALDLDG